MDVRALEKRARTLAEAGKTPMFVALDGREAGLVAVADTIKPSARETLRRLEEMVIAAVMMTGDNWRTAEAVARELGIQRVFTEAAHRQGELRKATAGGGQARGHGWRRGKRCSGSTPISSGSCWPLLFYGA